MGYIQYIPPNPAKLAFVGRAPDKVDCLRREPFVGPDGRYFSRLIKTAGIDRSQVYLTNTVHTQLPNNIYYALPKNIIDEGKQKLKEDLESWKALGLTTIIAMGNEALGMLTDKPNVHRYRGSVMPCTLVNGLKVYPAIHPGNIIRGEGKYEPIFIMDCKKALADSTTAEIIYPHHDIQILRHEIDAITLLQTYSNIPNPVVIDIETAGPKMTAYGWAINSQKAFVITSELLEKPNVLRAIGRFTKSSTPKIFHNCLFDVFHNAYYYKILNKNIFFDTMVAQHSVYPTLPKSLAFCASIYTKEPYWKDEGKEAMSELKHGKLSWENLYIYNGKDCCLTYEVYLALLQEIKDWNVEDNFKATMDLIGPALYAQMRGLLIDNKDNWAYTCASTRLTRRNTNITNKLEHIKEEIVGSVNVNSPKQMSELIYGTWDFPKPKGRNIAEPQDEESGGATGEKQLRSLARYPTPYQTALGLLVTLKKQKKMSTFFNPNVDSDNHVRCSVKVTGTYTGRLSTSKSITGSGSNLQNQPKEAREVYVAEDGYIFGQSDLSQSEARIVAALCGDPVWLKEFDLTDLHTAVAALLFNITPDKVIKWQRNIAKKIAHGTHYGMGPMLLSEILGCTPRQAKQYRDRYLEIRNKVTDWHKKVANTLITTKCIKTPFGRVIQFFGPITDNEGQNFSKIHREAIAAEPQSISVSYINQGLVKCYKTIPEFDFRNQVHDSILFQMPDNFETIDTVFRQMKELIEVDLTVNNITFRIPLNFELGYDWKNMIELKSLNDIKKVHEELQFSRLSTLNLL